MAVSGISAVERPWERADDLRFNRPDLRTPSPGPGSADYSQYRQQGLRGGQWVNQPPPPAAPVAPGAPSGLRGAASGAADWVVGERARAPATGALGNLRKYGGGAATALGRAAGLTGYAGSLRDNFNAMSDLAGSGKAGLSDYAAGGVEFLGNTLASGAANLSRKFPVIGPAIAGAIGPNAASDLIEWASPGASVLKQHGLGAAGPSPIARAAGMVGSSPVTPQNTQPRVRAQPQATQAQPGQPQPQAPNPIIRQGNSYSGTNIGPGAPIMQRGANGQMSLRDAGYVPSGIDSGAASAQRVADIYRSMAPQGPAMTEGAAPSIEHSGNSWARRNELRNAEVGASALRGEWDMYRDGAIDRNGRPTGRGGPSAAQSKYAVLLGADKAARGEDAKAPMDAFKSNNTLRGNLADAQARQYGADQGLRGTMYSADQTAATARAKAASEGVLKQNELDITNADRTRKQFAVYGADGKPDEGATQQAVLAVDKVIPGYSTMSEQARKQHSGQADAVFGLYQRLREQKELGLGQAIFGNQNPGLDAMPNLKGGKLRRHGLAGALPGQAGAHGYFIDMGDGRELNLGQGLSTDQLGILQNHLATGEWRKQGGR